MIPKASIVEKFAAGRGGSQQAVWAESSHGDRPAAKVVEYLDMTGIGSRILLHPDPEVPRLTAAMGKGSTIAIGPEGGFSDEEVNQAIASGWRVANLGQRVTNRDGRGGRGRHWSRLAPSRSQ